MKKKGHINSRDARAQAIGAAEVARQINKGKVEVKINERTTLLLHKHNADKIIAQHRIIDNERWWNKKKMEHLIRRGWRMGADGLWRNKKKFLTKDMNAALVISKYYEQV